MSRRLTPRLLRLPAVLLVAHAVIGASFGMPAEAREAEQPSRSKVAAFEDSWTVRALAFQRSLDDDLPLLAEMWVHTHNSYNSRAYDPSLSGLDSNQIHSIGDQLRMGVRAIEIDVHWAPSPSGRPEDGFRAPIACHGESVRSVHFGCTSEAHVRTRLGELDDWLTANPGDVVLLYLENHLDAEDLAHRRVVEAIEETVGSKVFRPAGSACDPLPLHLSRAAIRATGAQLLLAGDCGPGGWTSWVFDRGPLWDETSSGPGVDHPDHPDCGPPGAMWTRRYEDLTMLTRTVEGAPREIPPAEAARMARCGINMIGFDHLVPFDPKLDALVWSWAPGQPSGAGCAYAGADGRFRSGECAAPRPHACRTWTGWVLSTEPGARGDGEAGCASIGARFDVPRSGYDNAELRAAAGGLEAWLPVAVR